MRTNASEGMNKDNVKLEIAGRAPLALDWYISWVDMQLATHPSLVNYTGPINQSLMSFSPLLSKFS